MKKPRYIPVRNGYILEEVFSLNSKMENVDGRLSGIYLLAINNGHILIGVIIQMAYTDWYGNEY